MKFLTFLFLRYLNDKLPIASCILYNVFISTLIISIFPIPTHYLYMSICIIYFFPRHHVTPTDIEKVNSAECSGLSICMCVQVNVCRSLSSSSCPGLTDPGVGACLISKVEWAAAEPSTDSALLGNSSNAFPYWHEGAVRLFYPAQPVVFNNTVLKDITGTSIIFICDPTESAIGRRLLKFHEENRYFEVLWHTNLTCVLDDQNGVFRAGNRAYKLSGLKQPSHYNVAMDNGAILFMNVFQELPQKLGCARGSVACLMHFDRSQKKVSHASRGTVSVLVWWTQSRLDTSPCN